MNMSTFVPQPAGPSLQSTDIDRLEKRWGLKLPDDYKAFLLEVNGGVPFDPVVEVGSTSLFVQFLFYIDPTGNRGIDDEIAIINSAPQWVPIALEGKGGRLILSTEGRGLFHLKSGKFPNIAEETKGESNFVAKSWADFLKLLKGDEFGEAPQENLWSNLIRESAIDRLDSLLRAGFDINSRSPNGNTLMQIAAIRSNTLMLETLLERGGNIDGAVHAAAKVGSIPMIDWLCSHGAQLDQPDGEGRYPEELPKTKFVALYIKRKRLGV